MIENPSKDKNRGPRKNFRLYKTIKYFKKNSFHTLFLFYLLSELIIRCIDRKLETMTIFDSDSLELFLHDHIVPLWEASGWMTAKYVVKKRNLINSCGFLSEKSSMKLLELNIDHYEILIHLKLNHYK